MDILLSFSDILCIQEHFLLDCKSRKSSNTDKLRNRFIDRHDMVIKPAIKDNKQVSRGRGKGGLAIIWNKSLTKYVSSVESRNERIQAVKFEFPTTSVLIINAYFPCDPRTANYDDTEIVDILVEVQSLAHHRICTFWNLRAKNEISTCGYIRMGSP